MAIWHLFITVIEISEQLHPPEGDKRGGADTTSSFGAAGDAGRSLDVTCAGIL